jgi:hypothetical protein
MVFEGINFNESWAAGVTFEQFCEEHKHHGLTKKKLREAYDACKKQVSGTDQDGSANTE